MGPDHARKSFFLMKLRFSNWWSQRLSKFLFAHVVSNSKTHSAFFKFHNVSLSDLKCFFSSNTQRKTCFQEVTFCSVKTLISAFLCHSNLHASKLVSKNQILGKILLSEKNLQYVRFGIEEIQICQNLNKVYYYASRWESSFFVTFRISNQNFHRIFWNRSDEKKFLSEF